MKKETKDIMIVILIYLMCILSIFLDKWFDL